MLLQQLHLKNIRSYIDQTITFPKGSTLLSGDIGSGKSTILLAIEFALFGTARPDLPAEALLRKGCTSGSVELTFSLQQQSGQEELQQQGLQEQQQQQLRPQQQHITIQRSLKKERDAIKQLPGYLIINNVKKELMPIELKAEMLALLGYPEEDLTKNKNYLFRYTIYTPQEEMKLILHDDPEFRLDCLRKIFRLDKYKIVRENIQQYLKQIRVSIKLLEMKTEPLESIQQQQQELLHEQEQQADTLQQFTQQLNTIHQQRTAEQTELEGVEQQQRQFRELQQKQKTFSLLLLDKIEQRKQVVDKEQQLQTELASVLIAPETTLETVQREQQQLEQERTLLLGRRTLLQEQLVQVQRRAAEHQQEIANLSIMTAPWLEKEQLLHQLQDVTKGQPREHREEAARQLDELLAKTAEMITRNETVLQQAQEIERKITALDSCPTCLQPVSLEHKQQVQEQQQGCIKQAELLLKEFQHKKTEILLQKEKTRQELLQAIQRENLLTRTILEVQQLQEKKAKTERLRQQLQIIVQENNALMKEIQQLQQENRLPIIEQQSQRCQETVEALHKKKFMEQVLQEQRQRWAIVQEQCRGFQQSLSVLETQLAGKKDQGEEMIIMKKTVTMLIEQEKNLSVQQARLQAQLLSLTQQQQQAQQQIQQLLQEKNTLARVKELYHWLEEYFVNLTYTIEKHFLVSIHQLLSQLFQEWFSILVDDEAVSSRIDDNFTPIIEQNGYEITFSNLSGGEKTSAALAYRLALNRVINEIVQDIKTKELLILDEPTDGFSSEQLDKVREVLERLNLHQTIIVSHESKIESFVENIVRIKKAGQVSEIQQD